MSENYTAYTFYIFYGKINCTGRNFSVSVDTNWSFLISETEELSTELNTSISLQDKLCFKQITEENSQPSVIKSNRSESINESKPALLLSDDMSDLIILYGMVISLPFLCFTIFTYTLIKELRNLQGMFLMCLSMTMLINNILIIFRYYDRKMIFYVSNLL